MSATATVTAASITRTAPLLLTRDFDVIAAMQEVPGLAFTVVAATPVQAWDHWTDAPAVIVSADQVAAALAAGMPARHVVVVVNDRPADLVAVRDLVTSIGGERFRADVVPLAHLATVLPSLYAIAGIDPQ
jgi:hypothetical protein